jgi:hypothetical protein
MTTLVRFATNKVVAIKPDNVSEKEWLLDIIHHSNKRLGTIPDDDEFPYTSTFGTFKSATNYIAARMIGAPPKEVQKLCNYLIWIAGEVAEFDSEENKIYILYMREESRSPAGYGYEIFECGRDYDFKINGWSFCVKRGEKKEMKKTKWVKI